MVIFRKISKNDMYELIDKNMSDSNVGGRKGRNIRNHLFIVYGIINSVMNNESPPIDIQFYDLQQCFDAMWLEESMNDICDTIPQKDWNNKLALVYQNNSDNRVAIKTPFGLTDRVMIKNIVTQGGVWGPIQCSNQMDGVGKECVTRNVHLYTYKGLVKIMPLAMIDGILTVTKCGIDSVAANTFINAKMEMKKLIFSESKCKQLHVGKENPFCPNLEVHGNVVDKTIHEKYLGDIIGDTILCDGCNSKNIANRKTKGLGIVAQIMVILETVSLGYFLFEVATTLRESLLVNGILFNSEVWYSLSKAHIHAMEDVDKLLLRRVLGAPISTPSEAFYLELGVIPISFILKGRRVMFLHYILSLDETEMLSQFFYAQWQFPTKNDWTETVKKDLVDLDIPLSLDEIKIQSQEQFKILVKDKCRSTAFSALLILKESHRKMSGISYKELCLQPYFNDGVLHSGDAKTLFLFRTRMIRVRLNYKNSYSDLNCPLCNVESDSQEHLLVCCKIFTDGTLPDVNYSDIFGCETLKMKCVLEALKTALLVREELLKEEENKKKEEEN